MTATQGKREYRWRVLTKAHGGGWRMEADHPTYEEAQAGRRVWEHLGIVTRVERVDVTPRKDGAR